MNKQQYMYILWNIVIEENSMEVLHKTVKRITLRSSKPNAGYMSKKNKIDMLKSHIYLMFIIHYLQHASNENNISVHHRLMDNENEVNTHYKILFRKK